MHEHGALSPLGLPVSEGERIRFPTAYCLLPTAYSSMAFLIYAAIVLSLGGLWPNRRPGYRLDVTVAGTVNLVVMLGGVGPGARPDEGLLMGRRRADERPGSAGTAARVFRTTTPPARLIGGGSAIGERYGGARRAGGAVRDRHPGDGGVPRRHGAGAGVASVRVGRCRAPMRMVSMLGADDLHELLADAVRGAAGASDWRPLGPRRLEVG